jgi:hypothetical protein
MNRLLDRSRYLLALLCLGTLSSCSPALAPYERVYVNDPEMSMGTSSSEGFGQYVHAIREGAVAPQAQKGSGGCGCN